MSTKNNGIILLFSDDILRLLCVCPSIILHDAVLALEFGQLLLCQTLHVCITVVWPCWPWSRHFETRQRKKTNVPFTNWLIFFIFFSNYSKHMIRSNFHIVNMDYWIFKLGLQPFSHRKYQWIKKFDSIGTWSMVDHFHVQYKIPKSRPYLAILTMKLSQCKVVFVVVGKYGEKILLIYKDQKCISFSHWCMSASNKM